jgi:ATP-binding cassette subfamily B protein
VRESLRTIRTILEAAYRVDPKLTVASAVLAVAGWIVIPLQALAIRAYIDAITTLNAQQGAVATVAAAVTIGGLFYFNNLRSFVLGTLQERTTHDLDRRLQTLIVDIPGIEHLERPDYLDRVATLRAQSYAFGNVGAVFEFPALTLNVLVSALLLASVSPVLLVVPFAVLPAIFLTGRNERILQHAESAVAPIRRARGKMLELATDPDVAGEARLFDARSELLRRHRESDGAVNRILARAGIADVGLNSLGWALYATAFAWVFVVVVDGIRAGQMSVGDLFLVYYLVRGLQWQSTFFLYSIGDIRRTATATHGYLWLADYAASVTSTSGTTNGRFAPGDLRFEHVSFRYPGTTREVLADVNFTVPAGSVLALVGDNGAGKTTIVKLLARFYQPTAGRITIGGRDIATLDLGEWRAGLTACFQDFCRFELVARETVGVGDVERLEESGVVERAIADGGADAVVESLPDRLATPLGASWPHGVELSVGQWQKLALGRAMMRERPHLLLLDEPTAALDAPSEARLLDRYAAASSFGRASGSITVIVSHRMSTVRMAEVIAVVEDGRVTEVGGHAELIERDGTYRHMYTAQAAAYR